MKSIHTPIRDRRRISYYGYNAVSPYRAFQSSNMHELYRIFDNTTLHKQHENRIIILRCVERKI